MVDNLFPDGDDEVPKRFRRNPSPLAQCIIAADGNVNAGVLLHQIQYRFTANDTLTKRDGNKWIAQSRDNWLQETALTLSRYKNGVAVLAKLKLIEVRYWKFKKHHQWQMTFIRLHDEAIKNLSGEKIATDSGVQTTADNGVNPATDSGGKPTDKKDKTTGENGKDKVLPSATNPVSSKEKKESEEDTLPLKKDIEKAWMKAHETHRPKLKVTPFVGPDFNAADTLIKKLGQHALEIVDAAVANWNSFIGFAEKHGNLYKSGDIPDIHLLAKHANLALNWWCEGKKQPNTKSPAGKMKTMDEIMADEKKVKKITGSAKTMEEIMEEVDNEQHSG